MSQEIDQKPKTTGHSWDGIEECTNPDPVWLRLFFYGAVFFALAYWMLYPSWPTPNEKGWLEWTSLKELEESQREIVAKRAEYQEEFDKLSFEQIFANEKILKFALVGGKSAFEDNCAPCHGVGGGGNLGYPNLTVGSWLWGGKIDDIYTTLKYGIRSGHEETRESEMAAFGKNKILTPEEIESVSRYLAATNSKDRDAEEKGKKVFSENCTACHGKNGEGNHEFGAPNLKDAIWLYGNSYEQIYDVIFYGRAGLMPYWIDRLSDSTIRQLAIYVHQLGGGE